MAIDHELLFGALSVKLDLIDHDQLHQSCDAWRRGDQQHLSQVLTGWRWLTRDDTYDVQRVIDRKLEKHRYDVRGALATVADSTIRDALGRLKDPDIDVCLSKVPMETGGSRTAGRGSETRQRYVMEKVAAEGNLGKIWLARDVELNRQVALKEIHPDAAQDAEVRSRFIREAQVTGRLEHLNIVPVYELVHDPASKKLFYTMRFVGGRTLQDEFGQYHEKRKNGQASRLDLVRLLDSFVDVCNALAYAHSKKIVHRDLKPENVAVGEFGEVIVLDWGLARVMDSKEKSDNLEHVQLTRDGRVMGTPAFMAPEQAGGMMEFVDERTDIYGLGAILFELLLGRPPHMGTDVTEIIKNILIGPSPTVRSVDASIPRPLDAICGKAMAKEKTERYATPTELANDIQQWLADEPVSVYREPYYIRTGRWMRQHRTWVTSAAVAAFVSIVTLSMGIVLLTAANNRERNAKNLAKDNEQEARHQQERAEENFKMAQGAVDKYFTQVSEDTLLRQPGMQPLRHQLLNLARDYYEEFVARRSDDSQVQDELAVTLYRVGKITEDVENSTKALALYE